MMDKILLWFQERSKLWIKPVTSVLIIDLLSDLTRSHTDLVVENALLRQQLIVLNRQIKRIRGELLKPGIEVSKRTIQRYMQKERKSRSSTHIVPMPFRETWATILKNQASDIWACDFTVVTDWLFRQWYVFVVMELKTRRIVNAGVTKYPTDEWTAQQL
jgi:hypothetical protein